MSALLEGHTTCNLNLVSSSFAAKVCRLGFGAVFIAVAARFSLAFTLAVRIRHDLNALGSSHWVCELSHWAVLVRSSCDGRNYEYKAEKGLKPLKTHHNDVSALSAALVKCGFKKNDVRVSPLRKPVRVMSD